ncbi:MAG: hypothetical protein SOZ23_05165 [Methanosphaera sp.]|uniref:hypothetical protein n=1 Tax=Methanosphaera sp. TaxID=2666342 RepID=UPI0025D7E6E8|nr:hypothetical protein [Methanosphaera sp.]MCI5867556.1 hypothetical protein [Methanosphaera sp.]MDD6534023.1 hypothetical protein [Methanosphaera sp.]MDY3956167.1 hypothetical protein [Methanosphaera sp.]
MVAKNKWLAVILSLLISGLGQAYLGLYDRLGVFLVVMIILLIIAYISGGTVANIFNALNTIWTIYSMYDAYVCTEALNKNQPIPELFGHNIQ